jgi:undecaprenyl-diphosphatase
MGYLHAVILGIVEGVTEFLPISSTGHLVLAADLLGLEASEFLKTFEIVIQAGAVMAVLSLYGLRLVRDWRLTARVMAAFIPTAIVGLLLYPVAKELLGSTSVVLAALGVGGVLMILFERWYDEPADASEDLSLLPWSKAVFIGLAQCLAMVPGVSRSATTIIAGLVLGLSRRAIVEFSFLLAIPTLGAATALDLFKNADLLAGSNLGMLAIGFLTSWVVALVVIRWLLRFVRTHDFTIFGFYRVALAVVLAWVLLY